MRAATLYEESLAFSREAGDRLGIAADLNNLANAVFDLGDYGRATALYEESLALYREGGDLYGASLALYNLGDLACHTGNLERAQAYLGEALELAYALDNELGCAEYIEKLAWLAVTLDAPARAVRLWGAAGRQRETLGAARSPEQHAEHAQQIAAARARLDQAAFMAAWNEGYAMKLEQAVAYALDR
jgi:tetratricopeptide (TPR) repeat protein